MLDRVQERLRGVRPRQALCAAQTAVPLPLGLLGVHAAAAADAGAVPILAGAANGGEYRKTYHVFPAPFARLLSLRQRGNARSEWQQLQLHNDQKLADQSPGSLLPASVPVVSSTVLSGKRTVVMTRAPKGKTAEYFTFDVHAATIPTVNAPGAGPELAYHKSRDPVTLNMLPVVCARKPAPFGSKNGKLKYALSDAGPEVKHPFPDSRPGMFVFSQHTHKDRSSGAHEVLIVPG